MAYEPAPESIRPQTTETTSTRLPESISGKLTAVLNGIQSASNLQETEKFEVSPLWKMAATISSPICAYHGYKRNNSVGWAIWWGLMGGFAPVIAPAIAYAQGFGKLREK